MPSVSVSASVGEIFMLSFSHYIQEQYLQKTIYTRINIPKNSINNFVTKKNYNKNRTKNKDGKGIHQGENASFFWTLSKGGGVQPESTSFEVVLFSPIFPSFGH